MINPISVSEKLLFTTVKIETTTNEGKGTGTGFFYNYKIDDQTQLPLVITNKHVVKDAVSGKFLLHEAKTVGDKVQPSGSFFPVTFDKFEQRWFGHSDDEIDLCGMPINPLIEQFAQSGKEVFRLALDASIIKSD
ncbi:MAG: serine protease, partial [Deltaproteobacteria bacterium]|nr:serine protease [Deltaproteobacteria bacterium]